MRNKCLDVSEYGDVCQLAPGHHGVHVDGGESWTNLDPPPPEPVPAKRQPIPSFYVPWVGKNS